MFRRIRALRAARQQRAFFNLIERVRDALKDLLFSDEDRAAFHKLKTDNVKHQELLDGMEVLVAEQSEELAAMKKEAACLKTGIKGLTLRVNDHATDIGRLFKDIDTRSTKIKLLSKELYTVKCALSLSSKIIQDELSN